MSVTVDDVKAHLNITFSTDDALIARQLEAATDVVEGLLGFSLADLSPLPPSLEHAVLLVAAHLYTNREAVLVGVNAQDLPLGVWDIIAAHRNYWSEDE